MNCVRSLAIFFGVAVLVVSAGLVWERMAFSHDGSESDVAHLKSDGASIYRAPLLNNPKTLDPALIQDAYGKLVARQLFDGLVQFSRDLFVIPALAENWQVEDGGRTYRFALRQGATFHNGRPITSQDVVFSLSRLFRCKPAPTILPNLMNIQGARDYMEDRSASISGLQALDDRNVLIRLERPYAPFLVTLGMHNAAIVPAEAAADESSFGLRPVGSGPFRLLSWEENRSVRLEKYEGYYGGASRLDRIDFIIYPGIGIEAVWKDFQLGRLEEMPLHPQFRDKFKTMPDLQRAHRPSLSIQFYGFNMNHPRVSDIRFRSRLSNAIDRARLVSEVYGSQLEPAHGILPPGIPGYSPQGQTPSQPSSPAPNPEDFTLDESAGKTAVPVEIVSNSQSQLAQSELQFVSDSWKKVGVRVEAKYVPDWDQFEQYLRSDRMQIYRYAWFADLPDPDDFLRVLFSTESPVNFTRYHSSTIDRMLQEALGILDPMERARRYQEIEIQIMKDVPAIPLVYPSVDIVYQPYVRNMEVTALGAPVVAYYRVWLDHAVRP
jgi:ABC-type oligopeptide transport system substrate-binding subunit